MMQLKMSVVVFFLAHRNYLHLHAFDRHREFGYHCVDTNSGFDLSYMERRETCREIPSDSDQGVEEYTFGRIKCNRLNYRVSGECGENKIFIESSDKNNSCGVCVCNDNEPRKLIYHPPTNKCYYIYERGLCPERSLITLNHETRRLGCTPNPCHSDDTHQVLFKGKCVELYTQPEECKEDEVFGFDWNEPEPKCNKPQAKESEDVQEEYPDPGAERHPGPQGGGGGGIFHFSQTPDECPHGEQLSISGKCAGSWEW